MRSNLLILTVSIFAPLAAAAPLPQIYWTNDAETTIERVDTDGANLEVVLDDPWDFRSVLAVDPAAGHIYTDGWAPNRIQRMDLDGMRLVVIDADEINDDLRKVLNLSKVPSVLLVYRQQIATHLRGDPTDSELTELIKLAKICYDVTQEDNMLDDLLKGG